MRFLKHILISFMALSAVYPLQAQNLFYHLLGQMGEAPFTWTGYAADNSWSNPGNWSSNAVPGIGDIAKFKGSACAGLNCNATIDMNINVLGVEISSDYSGTITQASTRTVTVGTSGWTQASGTFTGGDSSFTNAGDFSLATGTFTSTSATYLHRRNFTISSGTFNHNNGRLRFDNEGTNIATQNSNISLNSNLSVWDLQYAGGFNATTDSYTWTLTSGSFNVQNEFRMGRTQAGANGSIYANGGAIYLKGNLILDPANPAAASPTGGGTTLLTIDGTSNQTYTSATTGSAPSLVINKSSGTFEPLAGDNSFLAESLTIQAGSFLAPTGTLTIKKEFTTNAGTTFTHNSGTLAFDTKSTTTGTRIITTSGSLAVHHLNFGGGSIGSSSARIWTLVGGPLLASGNLTTGNTVGSTGLISINGSSIEVSGNYTINSYSESGTTLVTLKDSNSQTIMQSVTSAKLQGSVVTVDKPTGTATQTTAVSLSATGQDLNINSGLYNMAGFNLSVNDNLRIGPTAKLLCNGGTVLAASYTVLGEVSCGPAIGITWTGTAGDGLWTTAGNWTNNTIPGASDIAIFNDKCVGANCNASINANISVKGVLIQSTYPGILTQNTTRTITIGTSGWIQQGGTFTGSDSAITLNGPYQLLGGNYSAPSATITANSSWTSTAGTFTAGAGTVSFRSALAINPSPAAFNHVTINGTSIAYTLSSDLIINGNLIIGDTANNSRSINGSNILAKGNVTFTNFGYPFGTSKLRIVGNTDQTITGASSARMLAFEIESTGGTVSIVNTLRLVKNYSYISGNLNQGAATLQFEGDSSTNPTLAPGSINYTNISILGCQANYTLSNDFNVTGLFMIGDTNCNNTRSINGANILAQGNVTFNGQGYPVGTSKLRIVGNTDQTITGASSARMLTFEIESTGGTVTFANTLRFFKNYTYISGNLNQGAATLQFEGDSSTNPTLAPGNYNYNNISIIGCVASYTLSNDFNVTGLLIIGDSNCNNTRSINGANILAQGNVTFNGQGYPFGTSKLRIVGNTDQTITGASSARMLTFEIESTGGTVTLANTLRFFKNYTHISGNVNAGTSTIQFEGDNTTNPTLTPGTSVNYNNVSFVGCIAQYTLVNQLNVLGALVLGDGCSPNRTITGGVINAHDDVTIRNNGYTGSVVLNMLGSSNSLFSRVNSPAMPAGTFTVDKSSSASVLISNTIPWSAVGQDMTLNSGIFDMAGFNLTVNDVLTVGTSGTLLCRGGTLTRGSLVNNGTVDCALSPFTWTGAGGNSNWNTAANWSGGIVPGTSDVATFDSSMCGANCNATVNVDPNVLGIRLNTNFTGTVTQSAGVSMTIGASGFFMDNGTFNGSDSAITVNGNLILNAGTFRAPSSNLTASANIIFGSTHTFIAGTGTVTMTGVSPGGIMIPNSNTQFNNLTFAGTNSTFRLNSGTIAVNGNLTLGDSAAATGGVSAGTINVKGDVSYNGVGYVGSAILNLIGDSNSSVSVAPGASVLASLLTINKLVSGAIVSLNSNLTLPASGQSLTLAGGILDLNGNTLTVNNALTLNANTMLICGMGSYSSGSLVNNGTIICAGYGFNWTGSGGNSNWNTAGNWSGGVVPGASDVAIFDDNNCGGNCNATMNVNVSVRGLRTLGGYAGTITQASAVTVSIGASGWSQNGGTYNGSNANFTTVGDFTLNSGTFNSTTSTFTTNKSFFINAGTFNHNNGTTMMTGNNVAGNLNFSWKMNGQTFNHLTILDDCFYDAWTATVIDTVNVAGNLTLNGGTGTGCQRVTINTNSISVKGNVIMQGHPTNGIQEFRGTTVIRMTGNSNQTYTESGTAIMKLPFEIASTGGTVSFPGDTTFGKDFIYTSGNVTLPTNLKFKFPWLSGNYNITLNPGSLEFNNVRFDIDCNFDLYTVNMASNLIVNGTLTFNGGVGTSCSSTTWNNNKMIAKGNVVLTGNATTTTLQFLGTTILRIAGSSNQTITQTGLRLVSLGIEVASTGGTVSMGSHVNWNGTNQDLTIVSGILNMAGYNLTIARNITNSGTLRRGTSPTCGTLSYSGVYSGNAAICP